MQVLHNMQPTDSIYQIMVTLSPPAAPYQKPPKTDKAFALSKINWEDSYPGYFVFDEDPVIMRNQELFASSCLILDVKRYNFKTKTPTHYGFGILPLTQMFQNRVYFTSGMMQVPLYTGETPQKLIEMLV